MTVRPADLEIVPLFSSLPAADLDELANWFDVQTPGEGVNLTHEGASGYSFFVIADGGAVVTADGAEVATLGPGDFFGEMAILGNGRRNATVTTTAPSRLFVLFGTDFRKLQQTHPAIAEQLEAAMAERLQRR